MAAPSGWLAAPQRLQQPGRACSGDGKFSAQFLTPIVE